MIKLKEGQKIKDINGNTYLTECGDYLQEEKLLKFKSYKDFYTYWKKNNLSLKDRGPFIVENNEYETVIDVLEAYEEG